MKRNFRSVLLLSVLMLVGSFVQAQEGGAPAMASAATSSRGPRPLPPLEEVKSALASSDQSFEKLYLSSEPVPMPADLQNKFEFVQDVVAIEVGAIWDLIKDKSVPNNQKKITLVRYTMGDSRVEEALIAAREAGIATRLVADFNPIVRVDFKEDEKMTSDSSRFKFTESEDSHSSWIKKLLKAGFEIGKDIFSQPVYRAEKESDRVPIMHEKALLLERAGAKTLYMGTANLAANPRYNRIYKISDQQIFDIYSAHIENLIETYKQGKPTSEAPVQARKRLVYQDGTYFELAYTDGKYNTNQRMVEALNNNTLLDGTLSHFVITYRDFLEALEKKLEENKTAKLFTVSDDRFSELDGWGLAPVLGGIDVKAPFSKAVEGFKAALWKRIQTFVYQRPAIDPVTGEIRIERTEDGPPTARHVWHDKTTVLYLRDKAGKVLNLLFSGSFNLSNNSANAEFQFEMSMRPGSWLMRATEISIRNVAKSQPQWAVPVLLASIRNALAKVFGLTDLEIPLEIAKKIEQAAMKRDFVALKDWLTVVAKIETQLAKPISPEIRKARLEQFLEFLSWYESKSPKAYGGEVKMRHFLNIAHILGQPGTRHYEKAMLIDKLLWRPGISRTEMNQLIREGVDVLIKSAQVFDDGTIPIREQITKASSYDFDDTIMRLRTKILLFKKGSEEQKGVTTGEFADIRSEVGRAGIWADFEIRKSPDSFINFRTTAARSLVRDVKDMLLLPESEWKTEITDHFMEQLENKATADLVTIITARGHEREEMLEAIKLLVDYYTRKTGKKYYLPKDLNIYAVGKAADPSAEKAVVMTRILDFFFKIGIKEWTFYDDDAGNIKKMKQVQEQEKGRWPGMDINIKHAPYKAPASKSRAVVACGVAVKIG